ncbi:hypothetical protein JCM8097_004459 [Rhodosporidiobolus ruineniae]
MDRSTFPYPVWVTIALAIDIAEICVLWRRTGADLTLMTLTVALFIFLQYRLVVLFHEPELAASSAYMGIAQYAWVRYPSQAGIIISVIYGLQRLYYGDELLDLQVFALQLTVLSQVALYSFVLALDRCLGRFCIKAVTEAVSAADEGQAGGFSAVQQAQPQATAPMTAAADSSVRAL